MKNFSPPFCNLKDLKQFYHDIFSFKNRFPRLYCSFCFNLKYPDSSDLITRGFPWFIEKILNVSLTRRLFSGKEKNVFLVVIFRLSIRILSQRYIYLFMHSWNFFLKFIYCEIYVLFFSTLKLLLKDLMIILFFVLLQCFWLNLKGTVLHSCWWQLEKAEKRTK